MKYPESPRETPCNRGCCWTPTGVCARRYDCSHHEVSYQEALDRRDAPVVMYASAGVVA